MGFFTPFSAYPSAIGLSTETYTTCPKAGQVWSTKSAPLCHIQQEGSTSMKISMRLSKLVAPVLVLASALFGLTVTASAPASADTGDRQVTIHYYRADGEYANWNIWSWGGSGLDNPTEFNGEDDFGAKLTFLVTDQTATQLGFIIRTNDWAKEPGNANGVPGDCTGCDRNIDLATYGSTDVWLISGDPVVYTHNPFRTVTIHYNRPDGEYANWNIWSWNGGAAGSIPLDNPTNFNGEDDFGVKMSFVVTDPATTAMGFIIRTNDWAKEPGNADGVPGDCTGCDRSIEFNATGNTDVWLLSGDPVVYTQNPFRKVTLHYHRDDAAYSNWNVWSWGGSGLDNPTNFNGEDDFGVYLSFYVKDLTATSIGYLIRTNDWAKEPGNADGVPGDCNGCDRAITLPEHGDTEIWVTSGDATQYTSDPRGRTVVIHYWRPAGDYSIWNLWLWNGGGAGEIGFDLPAEFNGTDANGGVTYTFLVTDPAVSAIGFIVRTNSWAKEPGNQDGVPGDCTGCDRNIVLTSEARQDVWVKQGMWTVLYENPWGTGPTSQTAVVRLSGITASGETSLPAKTTLGSQIRWVSYTPNVCAIKGGHLLHTYRPGACRIVGNADAVGSVRAVSFTRTVTIK
ncbi:MAG: hypothetical protein RL410_14 [Actinomycetota bacterium]